MAGQKRKIGGGDNSNNNPVTVSAFAARKKLWGTASSSPSTPVPPSDAEEAENGPSSAIQGGRDDDKPSKDDVDVDDSSAKSGRPLTRRSAAAIKGARNDSSLPKGSIVEVPPSVQTITIPTPPLTDVGTRRQKVLTTFKPSKQNYQRKPDGCIVMKMIEGERLVILGNYGLKIREGAATIAGSTLSASDKIHWVHAPHCHALPAIRIIENSTVELHQAPGAHGLRKLERLSPVFSKLWNESSTQVPGRKAPGGRVETFQIILSSEDGPKKALLQDLVSPPEWNKKLAELVGTKQKKAPVIFVCGPKSSGKSTFGKLLANRLLTDTADSKKRAWSSVAVLDTDPGQPEYSPPGVISLNKITTPNLSPSFCHHPGIDLVSTQLRAHAIASVTPGLAPEHYVSCVHDLYLQYQKSMGSRCPLVINTPGWVQGTGLDILTELIKLTRPTEVIYMSLDGPEETVQALKAVCRGSQLATLPSQSSEYTSRTSLHLRTMQTMSYFHYNWTRNSRADWDSVPLTEKRPWKVSYFGKHAGIMGIFCYENQVPPSLLGESINGMILALVKVEDLLAFRGLFDQQSTERNDISVSGSGGDGDEEEEAAPAAPNATEDVIVRTPESLPLIPNHEGITLDPRHSSTLGLVLVRGIDAERKELQILTPIPDHLLSSAGQKLVLVAGKFDTPTWAYTEHLYSQSFVESTGGDDEGQRRVDIADEGTDEDSSEDEESNPSAQRDFVEAPWTEELHGGQKRSVGSKVWRVRRDLGKN